LYDIYVHSEQCKKIPFRTEYKLLSPSKYTRLKYTFKKDIAKHARLKRVKKDELVTETFNYRHTLTYIFSKVKFIKYL